MRHFTVSSAFVESPSKSNRTGTPALVHRRKADFIASIKAGWKFAAWVGANHTLIGAVVRFSQRRSVESPPVSSISARYVLEPLERMRRRVSERASSSMYVGSRPPGPAGTAVPCVVVDGCGIVWGCGGGAGGALATDESTVRGPESVTTGRDLGRNRSHTMNRTINTAAAVIIPVSRRSTMRAICEDRRARR